MDGLELAHEVRQRWSKIGVIVTSACHRSEVDEIAGCEAFIPKPCEPEVFIEALQRSAAKS
jgi:CheY-like chemotaxis protein